MKKNLTMLGKDSSKKFKGVPLLQRLNLPSFLKIYGIPQDTISFLAYLSIFVNEYHKKIILLDHVL